MHKVPPGREQQDNFPPSQGPSKIIDSICKLAEKHTKIAIHLHTNNWGPNNRDRYIFSKKEEVPLSTF